MTTYAAKMMPSTITEYSLYTRLRVEKGIKRPDEALPTTCGCIAEV